MYCEWVTQDRRRIPLAKMSEDHVRNAMSYMLRGGLRGFPQQRADCTPTRAGALRGYYGFTHREWGLIFAAELLRRSRVGVTV